MTASGHRVVDSHQHFWDLDANEYAWLTPDFGAIHRSFGVDDVADDAAACGVDGVVLVQAAPSYEDTDAMLAIAERWRLVVGVVGWVPLDRPAEAAGVLERYAADPRVVGVRHQVHDEPDPDWLLRDDVAQGLDLVARFGLTYDVVATIPRHLEHVPELARRHPGLRLVIDHLAKPDIAGGNRQPWADLLTEAAAHQQVSAKLSGLDTAADPHRYRARDLRPYLDHALESFGAGRLMFGSDWPISVLAGGYRRWFEVVCELLAELSADERASVLAGSAERFYGLTPPAAVTPDQGDG